MKWEPFSSILLCYLEFSSCPCSLLSFTPIIYQLLPSVMAPRPPAAPTRGRPQKDWNASRHRKLIRLWTLTELTKEEIVKVLAATGFDAGTTNIRAQLTQLLPSDYPENWRKYHPRDDRTLKRRFYCLRRCKRGRISKERRSQLRELSLSKTLAFGKPQSGRLESFEGPVHAYRNYAASLESTPVDLSWVDLTDSQPVDPSRLLLDGSLLSSDSSAQVPSNYSMRSPPKSERSPLGKQESSPGSIRYKISSPTMLLSSTSMLSYNAPDIPFSGSSSTSGKMPIVMDEIPSHRRMMQETNSRDEPRKRFSTLSFLREQLGDKSYPEVYLKHINSVLRYSSSNSWRSSWTTLSSRASSLLSKRDSTMKHHQRFGEEAPPPGSGQDANITLNEEEVWNQLVSEDSVAPNSIPVPSYHSISPLNRNCCSNPNSLLDIAYEACENCGFSPGHHHAIQFGALSYPGLSFISKVDFYGNTPLHAAAAAVKYEDFWKINHMIDRGADVNVCNSSGETFLHFLCQKGPRGTNDIDTFLEILRSLQRLNFSFSKRDYHGRTILHNLFRFMRERGVTYGIPILFGFFSLIKPDLAAADNAGNRLWETLHDITREKGKKYNEDLTSLTSQFSLAHFHIYPYQSKLANKTREEISVWTAQVLFTEGFTWIDSEGDTLLTALLKFQQPGTADSNDHFLRSTIKSIIEDGADIHMRDRNGDTALSLAAKGGFRLVVLFLLEKGANVHSRDYRGMGILSQLERRIALAADNANLWASIYSCYLALVDAGAKSNPTDRDEWMLAPLTREGDQDVGRS
ncbi:ankyrin [Hyaloscypha variabilis F]|uniref:Ankyrin n=1 Tax=Hyaloscypha variabilis (strain UAMH 11265 / GT02V1 / F) TaxID=1149755 RepID=A0A2J6R0H2_HYAVF|nr:ankyrin [Hyaloscypha variabilis F]